MKDKMDITVIVPVYNGESTIRICLDSLMNQSANNFMVFCIDDGSTDGSLAILEKYSCKYSNVKIFSKTNGGLSSARNYGLDYVETTYVMFVDCDDYVDCNFVRRMYEGIEENEADILSCGVVKETVNGDVIGSFGSQKDYFIEVEKDPDVICKMDVTACNKICRKTLFDSVRFPEGYVFEDSMTTPRLVARSNRVGFISDILYHYVMWDGSITRSQDKHLNDKKEICNVLFKDSYRNRYREQYDYLIFSQLFSYISVLFEEKSYSLARKETQKMLDMYENPSVWKNPCFQRLRDGYSFWGKLLILLIEKHSWLLLKILQCGRNLKNFTFRKKYVEKVKGRL